ncbi:MAG: FumA C-terminus/TtdB family hydratase beta subunit [Candidatus Cloacimonas sp.]|nr:FumA C-terminus/TtdB family hydratase beta subunit [Candidatus Cloacimonadota bacterium]
MREIYLKTPITKEKIVDLKCGDKVNITGTIYTGRDQAHRKIVELLNANEELPFDLQDSTLYYTGPILAKPPALFSSAGPTTSSRMDRLTAKLLDNGLRCMIGKGPRSKAVVESIIKNGAIYFSTIGGAGAFLATKIKRGRVLAFPELGTEAIYELYVEEFPCYVAIDMKGNSLYELR